MSLFSFPLHFNALRIVGREEPKRSRKVVKTDAKASKKSGVKSKRCIRLRDVSSSEMRVIIQAEEDTQAQCEYPPTTLHITPFQFCLCSASLSLSKGAQRSI